MVHRDVSPQNVLAGVDGVARVVDFGIAKATGRAHTTRDGQLKGKMPYMAPEQLQRGAVSRQSDIWSASVVLWELLTGARLFEGDSEGHIYSRIVNERAPPPSSVAPWVPRELDAIVARGLQRKPERRFATARDMAQALEVCLAPSTPGQVGAWVEAMAHESLAERAARLRAIEKRSALEAIEQAAPASQTTPAALPAAAPAISEQKAQPLRRRPVVYLVGLGVAMTAGAAGLIGLRATGARSLTPEPPPAPAVVAGASASPPVLASAIEAPVLPSSPPPAVTKSAAGPSASSSGPSPQPAPFVGSSKTPRRPPSTTATPSRDRCYTRDRDGIWHIKPECL
jgi:serine/threonine-protein kinase